MGAHEITLAFRVVAHFYFQAISSAHVSGQAEALIIQRQSSVQLGLDAYSQRYIKNRGVLQSRGSLREGQWHTNANHHHAKRLSRGPIQSLPSRYVPVKLSQSWRIRLRLRTSPRTGGDYAPP